MRHLRLVVAVAVMLAVVVGVEPADALRVPKTLAQVNGVGAAPVEAEFPIDFLGVQWDGPHGEGKVRFLRAGRWGNWQALEEDGVEVPGQFASGLISAEDSDAYQVVVPSGVARPRAVAINTTDGAVVERGSRARGAAEAAVPVITRALWGANESYRFDSSGREKWPPTYYSAQKLTVHHTATRNDDPDPASTVRAIYRYHAIDRGFGDIGYQYLIDEAGRVYEGRWSGTDGNPAHDALWRGVTGAHVGELQLRQPGACASRDPY